MGSSAEPPTIGKPGEPVRVLAFSGGAYGTIPQLGTAHALLASDAKLPDVVVGVSMGAVNAVALAEILRAGAGQPAPVALSAKIAKLMEVVEAYVSAQRDLKQALLPDIYQVDAQRPLTAPELPLQAPKERQQRERAIAAKAGLIRFVNDLLTLGLTVGAVAKGIRLALGWSAASELPRLRGAWEYSLTLWRAWFLFGRNLAKASPLLVTLTLHAAETFLPKQVRRFLYLNRGGTAAGLIFGSRVFRETFWTIAHVVGFLILALLWLGPLAFFAGLTYWPILWLYRLVLWVWPRAAIVGWLLAAARGPGELALWAGLLVMLASALALLIARRRDALSRYGHRVFRYYEIANGWFDPHPLRERLIQLFDPEYYGGINIDKVVSSILRHGSPPEREARPAKTLGAYASGTDPIHVGLVGARIDSGRLEVLAGSTPVVDALMVATALPPFFEAQQVNGQWYVDGALIVKEPTRALIPYLKTRVHPDAAGVHIYSVVPLPLSRPELGGPPDHAYTRLTEIALRSYRLQRFRDATLDRRMTHLYSRALKQGTAARPEPAVQTVDGKVFLRAWVYPLEPEGAWDLSKKLFLAETDDQRRGMILDAVADGCRSALEGMLPETIEALAKPQKSVKCGVVLASFTKERLPLPSASGSPGPGLRQICERCALNRNAPAGSPERGEQCLSVREERSKWPAWPHRRNTGPGARGPMIPLAVSEYDAGIRESLERMAEARKIAIRKDELPIWPLPRDDQSADEQSGDEQPAYGRPVVSLLFAGGVFRGVYLMGVVNALSEIGLRPDLIAGSSVGTITAAMTASVFSRQPTDLTLALDQRRVDVVRLVSAFLALDRLVLTDRFAEFVRSLTLRAAVADFSLRHLDHLFRSFDRPDSAAFSKEARRALAGIERLFYASPFDVSELTQALRKEKSGLALDLLGDLVQEFLDRGGVGLEVLGAAPLAALIEHYVVRPQLGAAASPGGVPLDLFSKQGIFFLATATNLTRGRLEYLGGDELMRPTRRAVLVESLLASSAFPAVFRPRWASEVMPLSGEKDQYVDGGIMDNLPLDAVAQFLNSAASAKLIAHRPRVSGTAVPHLMFTASLEVDPERRRPRTVDRPGDSWWDVYFRAIELGYNTKLDSYRRMQRDLRRIRERLGPPAAGPDFDELLDLEVVEVKPAWLCRTFAFHPMLGFRRADQAASIAHGCASTLVRFQEMKTDPQSAAWLAAWGIDDRKLDDRNPAAPPKKGKKAELEPFVHGPDHCFFRKNVKCPFSPSELARLTSRPGSKLTTEIVEAVAEVYAACGRRETHRARN